MRQHATSPPGRSTDSESSFSARIDAAERELHGLYLERARRMEPGHDWVLVQPMRAPSRAPVRRRHVPRLRRGDASRHCREPGMTAIARPMSEALGEHCRDAPVAGGDEAPDPDRASVETGTFADHLLAAERERNARLRRLWQMSAEQRIAAMRRGELTREQLAAWSARHPEQVPLLNGEWEWIAAKTPEACE